MPKKIPVYIDGVEFTSIVNAAKSIGVSESTIRHWIQGQKSHTLKSTPKTPSDSFAKGSIEHLRLLCEENGFTCLEDWYVKKREQSLPYSFKEWIKREWEGDLLKFLGALHEKSEVQWWRMSRVPVGTWKNRYRRLQYLKWLEKQLGYQSPSDWYKVTMKDFYSHYGGSLQAYVPSVLDVVKELYPDFDWKPWCFETAPNGTWNDKSNHRRFLDWVWQQRRHSSFEDWYSLTSEELDEYGGGKLRQLYDSIFHLVSENYPEHDFLFWNFIKSRGNWENIENQKRYLKWFENEMRIEKPEDWYIVTEEDFIKLGGITLLSAYYESSIALCIEKVFPEYKLESHLFKFSGKMEARLFQIIKSLYPYHTIISRYKHSHLRFSSGRKMELDIFFPDFQFAIEYDGRQHFESDAWGGEEEFVKIKRRDKEKDAACKAQGITLLRIRYDEWSGDIDFVKNLLSKFVS